MGLKGFRKYIDNESEKQNISIQKVYSHYGEFVDKFDNKPLLIGIDTNAYLYKYRISTTHPIISFLNQIIKFLLNKTIPIYIIDGNTPIQKTHIIQSRQDKRIKKTEQIINEEMNFINNNYDDINLSKPNFLFNPLLENILIKNDCSLDFNISKFIKISKDWIISTNNIVIDKRIAKEAPKISKDMVSDLTELLDLFGIKHIKMKAEADLICGSLYNKGLINGCLSGDMDLLPYGCGNLIQIVEGSKVVHYRLNKILKILNLTEDKFVIFCVLIGCDYVPYKINKKHNEILKIVKDHNTLEECIEYLSLTDININKYLQNYKDARDLYMSSRKLHIGIIDFSVIEPINVKELNEFMKKKITSEEWYRYHKRFETQIQIINRFIKQNKFNLNQS